MSSEVIDTEELKKALEYYKRRLDDLGGENLKKEYEISGLRKEVTQRRRAFTLLSQLDQIIGSKTEVAEIFKTAITNISATLGMDRVYVLTPAGAENGFRPEYWVGRDGLDDSFIKKLTETTFDFPPAFATDMAQHLFANSKTESTPLIQRLRDDLGLPFFASVPVIVEGKCIGIMVMGRLKEVGSVFPPIDMSDIETLQAIASLISAVVQNMRVGILKEMDRMKTEFFANISHEFRTPITLTIGPLEGLVSGRYGELSARVLKEAEIMLRNQKRLLGLINQILDLEKMESGAMKLQAVRIPDVNVFVLKRVEQFQALAEKRGIELRTSLDPGASGSELYADPEKLDKVVFNLLSNACKFTRSGHVEAATEISGDALILRISDTGIGIRSDQLIHIFDRFKQADGSASREFAGTGIGLALVKQIVELHRGQISVHSEYGKGTTMKVSLPLGKGHLAPEEIREASEDQDVAALSQSSVVEIKEGRATPEQIAAVSATNEETLRNPKPEAPFILYVDDNQDLRDFVHNILKDRYNVLLATDGRDGFEKAMRHDVDLILSDLMMPVWTGADLLKHVKEEVKLQGVPFVMLTAKSSMSSRVSELERGADDYLNKPFSEVELLARLSNLIKLRQQQLRLKRELRAAREIQQSLLPPLEQRIGGLSIEVLYHPSEDLSGDFFDTIRCGDWVYAYVADVTSHGTASAQVTYLIKGIFMDLLGQDKAPRELPELMAMVGRRYVRYQLDYAVGLTVLRIRPVDGAIEYVVVNAPPPVLKAPSKTEVLSCAPGSLIYAKTYRDDVTYKMKRRELGREERLFVYTDGCFEFIPRGRDREFGMRRLLRCFEKCGSESWKKELFEELERENGSKQFPDDLTVLSLSWKGKGG